MCVCVCIHTFLTLCLKMGSCRLSQCLIFSISFRTELALESSYLFEEGSIVLTGRCVKIKSLGHFCPASKCTLNLKELMSHIPWCTTLSCFLYFLCVNVIPHHCLSVLHNQYNLASQLCSFVFTPSLCSP